MTVITLVAAGGAKVDVDEEIAMLCEPFKKCLSVEDDDGKDIKCEDINERVLKEAMRFVETHEKDEKFGIDHPLTPEDERFFEENADIFRSLVKAAAHLNAVSLRSAVCRYFATHLFKKHNLNQ